MKTKLSKYQKSLFYEIFVNKEYSVLDEIIINSNTIFDVGSNIGLFSLYILSLKYNLSVRLDGDFLVIENNVLEFKDFKIHLFEPNAETYNLSKDILSSFKDNLIFNNIGILDKNGTFDMVVSEIDCQTSLYNSFLTKKISKNIKGEFIKLEDYLNNKNINQIDLLKLDVEGAEFDILLDLEEKYLKNIKVLFLEYHLLDETFKEKFEKLLIRLKGIYFKVEVFEGKYSDSIGYIICE